VPIVHKDISSILGLNADIHHFFLGVAFFACFTSAIEFLQHASVTIGLTPQEE
jgi:hypothetical protein